MVLKQIHKNIIFSILTGLLAVLAFPKAGLFVLIWAAFIPLMFAVMRSSPKVSLLYGFVAGFVFNAAGLYWLVPMLQFNTGSYVQAFAAAFVLWAYLALYWGAWSFFVSISKKYFAYPFLLALFAACAWALLEYVRTYFLTGFPWMLAGYSQYKFTEIIQIAEFTGVYGVSFIIIFCNMLFYFWLTDKKGNKYLYTALTVIFVVAVFGAFRLDKFKFFGDETFKAAVVQPNVDQYKKWDQSFKDEILFGLENLALEAAEKKADLTVWPETALPGFLPYDKQSYKSAVRFTGIAGGFNILGAPYTDGTGRLYNAVFAFKGGGYVSLHKKNHLVPFGEFVPFQKELSRFFGVLNMLGNFTRGTDTRVFTDGRIYAGATLCSENFFPDISRRFVLSGAKVLTNHTNDAWFFDTAAPYQHFMMNIFRAVENRKAMLVSANSGVSGIIEASGRIVSSLSSYKSGMLAGEFLQNDFITFYTRQGDVFVRLCAVITLVLLVTILVL